MISKNVFLKEIERLQTLFPEPKLTDQQVSIYYEKFNKDMDDNWFLERVQAVIENEYRFPPIAAFYRDYKKDGSAYQEKPSTQEDLRIREHYRKVTGSGL